MAATRLEFPGQDDRSSLQRSFSWSQSDVKAVAAQRIGQNAVLWGCDMEEPRPQALIRELAEANPTNTELRAAAALTASGYERAAAPALLKYVLQAAGCGGKIQWGGGEIPAGQLDDPALAFLAEYSKVVARFPTSTLAVARKGLAAFHAHQYQVAAEAFSIIGGRDASQDIVREVNDAIDQMKKLAR